MLFLIVLKRVYSSSPEPGREALTVIPAVGHLHGEGQGRRGSTSPTNKNAPEVQFSALQRHLAISPSMSPAYPEKSGLALNLFIRFKPR